MLLSLAISSIRKTWTFFNHLTLANIIQGVGRRTNNQRSMILSNFPSALTLMTTRRASSISNSKSKIRACFTSERYPRQKYTVKKVLRSRISSLLVDPEFWTFARAASSEISSKLSIFRWRWNRNRYTVTPQRFNSNKQIFHYSGNLNLTSETFRNLNRKYTSLKQSSPV